MYIINSIKAYIRVETIIVVFCLSFKFCHYGQKFDKSLNIPINYGKNDFSFCILLILPNELICNIKIHTV